MTNEKQPKRNKKIKLHPFKFEEALKGLLQTEPPPKEQKEKPATKQRPRSATKKIELYLEWGNMEALTDYQCPVCKLTYTNEHLRQQCEAWCRTHESCNLQIASQSLEAQKMRIPRSSIEHQSQEQPQQ